MRDVTMFFIGTRTTSPSARYFPGGVKSVLDLGCGTGGHAIPLARIGSTVLGVDRAITPKDWTVMAVASPLEDPA